MRSRRRPGRTVRKGLARFALDAADDLAKLLGRSTTPLVESLKL